MAIDVVVAVDQPDQSPTLSGTTYFHVHVVNHYSDGISPMQNASSYRPDTAARVS